MNGVMTGSTQCNKIVGSVVGFAAVDVMCVEVCLGGASLAGVGIPFFSGSADAGL